MQPAAEQDHRAGLEDEQKVQRHVDQVDLHSDAHGGARVPGGPEHGAEDHAGRPGQHGQIKDEEIAGGQGPQFRLQLHPARDASGKPQGKGGEQASADQYRQHGLGRRFARPLQVAGADGLGDHGQEAHAQGHDRAVDEPVHRDRTAHGSRGLSTQRAHHGRVYVLHRSLHQLLQHGGPGQSDHRGQQGPGEYGLLLPRCVHGIHHLTAPAFLQKRRPRHR